MKPLLLFLLLISLNSYAQSYPKIEGIGKFKINKTRISIIDSLKKEVNNSLSELLPDTTSITHTPLSSILCKGVRVFTLKDYVISGIKVSGIRMVFKDNILVSFTCISSTDLEEALRQKYGKPKAEWKSTNSHCYEDNTILKELVTYHKWMNNNILAVVTFLDYYNQDCKSSFSRHFYIGDKIKDQVIDNCNRTSWQAKAKAKLKDF